MKRKIKPGALVLLSSGEYSDYEVTALCRAMVEIDPEALKEEWLTAHPNQRDEFSADFSAFVAWLVNTKGVLEELECVELHLGEYSNLGPEVRVRSV